jgi:hypothetical protein
LSCDLRVRISPSQLYFRNAAEQDLVAPIRAGYGDTPLLEFSLRCEQCGCGSEAGFVPKPFGKPLGSLFSLRAGKDGHVDPAITVAVDLLYARLLRPRVRIVEDENSLIGCASCRGSAIVAIKAYTGFPLRAYAPRVSPQTL